MHYLANKPLVLELLKTSRIETKVSTPNPFSSLSSNPPERPTYRRIWAELTESQAELRVKLSRRYTQWYNDLAPLLKEIGPQKQKLFAQSDNAMRSWITVRYYKGMPKSIDEAESAFKIAVSKYHEALDGLQKEAESGFVLIPDTNALIACADLARYSELVGQAKYTVIIPSTVIAELDKLKVQHSERDFGKKVDGIIRRMKGWRTQGNVLEGVTVDKTVTVKMVAKEPSFTDAPAWLDSTNNDDRIIATVLEIQREHPVANVVLVTRDLNLQNKAEMAHLPFTEPPIVEKSTDA